ncbi:MAG: hypothetical protein FJ403_17130 [Verrucomicrobia bacterium]|nr:hypothetical protein [Verrucomicrobiota bacterium]
MNAVGTARLACRVMVQAIAGQAGRLSYARFMGRSAIYLATWKICNLRRSLKLGYVGQNKRAADCKSAIQQSGTLRYDQGVPLKD